MTNVPIPHIIQLLQIAFDISDEVAMDKWNMWVPYAMIVSGEDASTLISTAKDHNLGASIVGVVVYDSTWEEENRIIWVGVGKSIIKF
jgi:phosphoribosylaminoimidazole (AIR) synthetase